jgi:two-component system, OmpR family, alkaline phosphatase synthesis response regulator PhoP
MDKETILIAEDDRDIANLIKYHLEREGFKVFYAASGMDALSILMDEVIDLAVLDIQLPEVSGLDICRKIRDDDRMHSMPVMMVTAKTGENDVLMGFHNGADDYVTKPFSPKELVARIQALIKRTKGDAESYRKDDLEIFFNRHMAKINGNKVTLTPLEFKVLELLIRNKNRTVSRNSLLERVWGMDTTSSQRSVDIVITRIRTKIKPYGKLIRTITSFGYQWEDE